MKRIWCFLVIITLLTGASASADYHLEARCSFPGAAANKDASVDVYEQEGQVVITSTLFAEYAAVFRKEQTCSLSVINDFLLLSFEQIGDLPDLADSIFMQFLETKLSAPESGVFSGNIFSITEICQKAEFPLSEIVDCFQEQSVYPSREGEQEDNCAAFLYMLAGCVRDSMKEYDPLLCVQSFDYGCYLSCQIVEQDHVLLTISVDRSEKKHRKFLISYREDSLYCYRELSVEKERDQLVIRSSFRTGTSSIYQSAAEKPPLFTRETILSGGTDESLAFQCKTESNVLSEPIYFSGAAARGDEAASLTATVRLIAPETDEIISLSMILEPQKRKVFFTDKTPIDIADEKENTIIQLTAASNAAILAAGLMPALPKDYQNMLLKLIYP